MIGRFIPSYFQANKPRFEFGIFTPSKTKYLMDDRKIFLFCKQHIQNPYVEVEILEGIEKLQSKIYKLDKYGEKNWNLDYSKIGRLWNNILEHIISIGFTKEHSEQLLLRMYNYMQVEIGIRKNNLPSKISMNEYYKLKICDVQLQRAIIAEKAERKFDQNYYKLWELIDIVSEILDDFNDVKEDSKDYNCNRLLISKHLKGNDNVIFEYKNYISILKLDFENILTSQNLVTQEIFKDIFNKKIAELDNKINLTDLDKFDTKIFKNLIDKPVFGSMKLLAVGQ